jgi:hypothetical protein
MPRSTHLLIKLYNRDSFKKFIRAIAGLIAKTTLGVERGRALYKKFWNYRPFSRIIDWAKGYFIAKNYIIQNHMEATGAVPYQLRKHKYKCSTSP